MFYVVLLGGFFAFIALIAVLDDKRDASRKSLEVELARALEQKELELALEEVQRERDLRASYVTISGDALRLLEETRQELLVARAAYDALEDAQHLKRYTALMGKVVQVNTRGEHSIEGVLVGVYADSIVLAHAHYVQAVDGTRQNIDGEQIIPNANVEWIQEFSREHRASVD